MKQSFFRAAVLAAVLAGGLSAEARAQAAPVLSEGAVLTPASFQPYLFGGRPYCWYDLGWSGPGWYLCGDAWSDGLGWGGPRGWNGWRRGGRVGDHHGHGEIAHLGPAGGHFGGGQLGDGDHLGGGPGHVGGVGHFGGAPGPFGGGASHIGGGHFGGGHMGGGGGHFGGGGHAGGGHAGGGGGHR